MATDHKALIERLIEDVWNDGQYARLPRLVDESYVGHPSGVVGTAAYRRYYEDLRLASSDIAFSIEDQVAESDRVATRWTARGTHTGPFAGLAGTGRTYEFTGTSTHRIVGDKVVECWTDMDEMRLLRQLGALAAPASA
jgi:predicted ester cyclase